MPAHHVFGRRGSAVRSLTHSRRQCCAGDMWLEMRIGLGPPGVAGGVQDAGEGSRRWVRGVGYRLAYRLSSLEPVDCREAVLQSRASVLRCDRGVRAKGWVQYVVVRATDDTPTEVKLKKIEILL